MYGPRQGHGREYECSHFMQSWCTIDGLSRTGWGPGKPSMSRKFAGTHFTGELKLAHTAQTPTSSTGAGRRPACAVTLPTPVAAAGASRIKTAVARTGWQWPGQWPHDTRRRLGFVIPPCGGQSPIYQKAEYHQPNGAWQTARHLRCVTTVWIHKTVAHRSMRGWIKRNPALVAPVSRSAPPTTVKFRRRSPSYAVIHRVRRSAATFTAPKAVSGCRCLSRVERYVLYCRMPPSPAGGTE